MKILSLALLLIVANSYAAEPEWEPRIAKLEQDMQHLQEQLEVLSNMVNLLSKQSLPLTPVPLLPVEPPKLVLKSWSYHPEAIKFNTYYAMDIELYNAFSKGIKEVDATIEFRNLLGGLIYSVPVTTNTTIPAGASITDRGGRDYDNKRLLAENHQLRKMKREDINAELIVRKIVFDDNSVYSHTLR
ncbi:MAG: hypothetical protein BWK79_07375 [Beggiatoa sp. IS2]|nr:MAG: hypothetical protein BWK79_07375 [Beggiatoa sp. IS2]